MIPLAVNVWQSMDSELSFISLMMFFGGGLLLALFTVANSRLYRLLKAQREGNELLRQLISAEAASRKARYPSTAVGMTKETAGNKAPPLPARNVQQQVPPKEPGVYRID